MAHVQTALAPGYSRRAKFIDIILLASLSLGGFYVSARIALTPRDTTEGVAVIFAPWTSQDTTLARSVAGGARFMRFGGLPFIAVVMPDSPTYVGRMFGAGAWLIVDPRTLAACANPFSNIRTKS